MIIISSRKFRDNQNEILRKALSEEVILTTLHYGNFRLIPISEQENSYSRPSVSVSCPSLPAKKLPDVSFEVNPGSIDNTPIEAPNKAYSAPIIMVMDVPTTGHELESVAISEAQAKANAKEEKRREREWKDPLGSFSGSVAHSSSRQVSLTYVPEPHVVNQDVPTQEKSEDISQKADRVGEGAKERKVYVDPSLLTWEEFLKQEGEEPEQKKKGFFAKMFGKE